VCRSEKIVRRLPWLSLLDDNNLDKHPSVLGITIVAIWPLWFVWRFLKVLWRACSIVSIAVTTKHQRMRDQRNNHYFNEVY
jgi:hypothetical protein